MLQAILKMSVCADTKITTKIMKTVRFKWKSDHYFLALSIILTFLCNRVTARATLKGDELKCSFPGNQTYSANNIFHIILYMTCFEMKKNFLDLISDGTEVQIPNITKDHYKWRIRCICSSGIVKCEKIASSCAQNTEGCPFIQASSSTNKSNSK